MPALFHHSLHYRRSGQGRGLHDRAKAVRRGCEVRGCRAAAEQAARPIQPQAAGIEPGIAGLSLQESLLQSGGLRAQPPRGAHAGGTVHVPFATPRSGWRTIPQARPQRWLASGRLRLSGGNDGSIRDSGTPARVWVEGIDLASAGRWRAQFLQACASREPRSTAAADRGWFVAARRTPPGSELLFGNYSKNPFLVVDFENGFL